MAEAQLAEANLALPKHPLDDPRMAGFIEAIARVNLLAEGSPGFVWRLPSGGAHVDGGELTGLPGTILNVSVWADYESLHAFTYSGVHGRYFTERARWFEPIPGATTVLWWVPSGSQPAAAEAAARLRYLRAWGPTSQAFTVLRRFTPSGQHLRARRPGANPIGSSRH